MAMAAEPPTWLLTLFSLIAMTIAALLLTTRSRKWFQRSDDDSTNSS